MKRKTPANVGASVRARLLRASKTRHEDFTLILMNYAAERFLYRLSRSSRRNQFTLKGAMLFAVRIGEPYRPTRDLDLLGMGEPSEAAIDAAVRDIVATPTDDDGVSFDVGTLRVSPIREEYRYGGIRATMQAHLAEARIHVQIDIGFGDAVTPTALDLDFPTLLANMPSPNVLAYPTETIVAEKVEAMVDLGRSNSRMKDFTDLTMAARRVAFDGDALVAAICATLRRRQTPRPDGEIVALSEEFVRDERAQANWRAFAGRSQLRGFESLAHVVAELRRSGCLRWSTRGPANRSPRTGNPAARGRSTRRRSDSCPERRSARRGSRPRSADGTEGSLDARLRPGRIGVSERRHIRSVRPLVPEEPALFHGRTTCTARRRSRCHLWCKRAAQTRPAGSGALTDDDIDKRGVSDPAGGAWATFCAG